MTDRLDIAWYYNFEREDFSMHDNKKFTQSQNKEGDMDYDIQPRLMVNTAEQTVYVSLPPPEGFLGQGTPLLWAFRDKPAGQDPVLLFKLPVAIASMTIFDNSESESVTKNIRVTEQSNSKKNPWKPMTHRKGKVRMRSSAPASPSLWALLQNKEQIVKISPNNGTVQKTVNISNILGHDSMVTSEIMTMRSSVGKDSLVFGAKLKTEFNNIDSLNINDVKISHLMVSENATSFVVCLSEAELQWVIAVPDNLEIKGQIAGVKLDKNDVLVAFASGTNSSVIFGIK